MRHVVHLAALAAVVLVAGLAPPARACGGFFCNAVTQTPIIQAGERVLFARHDGRVTMHIEVVYAGDPTTFGWIVPVPEPPTDERGEPLPLDEAVSLSSQTLFPRLQSLTDPIFRVQSLSNLPESCEARATSTTTATAGFADATSTASDSAVNPPPPVVVLQEARVGPYDAQLIQAADADALFLWLADNGYQQDEAARPILDHYVRAGFVFVGIRLQSGKTTGDLAPLALSLGENAPCVPLRLTSIAATPDMPILVWVLGDGRAVPKNFLHARLNDLAFPFPGGGDYQGLVSRAIDGASGRAWVTEYAAPTAGFRGLFAMPGWIVEQVARAQTLTGIFDALPPSDPDVADVLRATIVKPPDLRGWPWGSCYLCEGCGEVGCPEPNAEHVTTDDEFYGFLSYWASPTAGLDLDVDVDALRARLASDVFAPRDAIEGLLSKTSTITRFYTMLDPSEMTRDPIFAFNPDLPLVSNDHVVTTTLRADDDCDRFIDVTWSDGRTWRVLCDGPFCPFVIGPVPGEEPLLWAEVLDETGAPIVIGDDQVPEVDRLLDGASVGLPTLPPSFVPEPDAPPASPPKPRVESGGSGGCRGGPEPALAVVVMVAVVALLALARRRRALW